MSEQVAVENCVMLGVAGSELYGTAVESGDHDYMGVCLEPANYVIGLDTFDQWQYHSAGEHVRSGDGDYDVTIYSLRKWARLAAQGNPTVLLLGFTPPDKTIVDLDLIPAYIHEHMHWFWTKNAIARFLGYLTSQREQMLGLRGRRHSNRAGTGRNLRLRHQVRVSRRAPGDAGMRIPRHPQHHPADARTATASVPRHPGRQVHPRSGSRHDRLVRRPALRVRPRRHNPRCPRHGPHQPLADTGVRVMVATVWLSESEACHYVSRSARQIKKWRLAGHVRARKEGGRWLFDQDSLRMCRELMDYRYKTRRIVPGSGRGRFKPVGMEPLFAVWDDEDDAPNIE